MRIRLSALLCFFLLAMPALAMEQQWIDDLNRRFPGIGDEFEMAVQQKLSQYGESVSPGEAIDSLLASPDYAPDSIANAKSFSLHSELMLLYPAIGEYEKALAEAKLLRDFILQHSPEDERVVQTFRGVYSELLLINGRNEEALKEIEQTIAINTSEAGNYLSQGVAYVKLQQLENALESLKALIQKPDGTRYAQQLFVFIMQNRGVFQEAQVQQNTMIDVMLKELEPENDTAIRVTSDSQKLSSTEAQPPAPAPQQATSAKSAAKAEDSSPQKPENTPPVQQKKIALAVLRNLDAEQISQLLGPPLMEAEGDGTFDRDYRFQGETLSISFDKKTQKSVSFQMFFLPPVDESRALAQIGLREEDDAVPTIDSEMLKVWGPYGTFSKLRLSLNEGQVIAVIVEP